MEVSFKPTSVRSGEPVDVLIEGVPEEFIGRAGEIVVVGIDSVETHWVGSIGGEVDADGRIGGRFEPALADQTVLEIASLRLSATDSDLERAWDLSGAKTARCLVADELEEMTASDLAARALTLSQAQVARFEGPLGDAAAEGALEHRVLCVVERLKSTRELRLPAASLIPLTVGNPGSGEPPLLDALLEHLGWAARTDAKWWTDQSASGRPWTALVIGPVYATNHDEAAKLAWVMRDRLTDVLALTRGSSPRPLATVVEQRQQPSGVKWRIYQEDENYRGNLVGGFIAGEDQRELLAADAAMAADPLLALCVRLFRDAQGERDVDAAYFRYWSLLEALSGGRFPGAHAPVTLMDGSTWPGQHNTTGYAGPRVYALIAGHLTGINEASAVAPAASLYEAVRAWYGRRNATGHYGALRPNDSAQQGKGWYRWAMKTWATGGLGAAGQPWLWTLQQTASLVLRRELSNVGRTLI
ncbi:MAG: hypothetical protein WKF94_10515 [Solirubrobacteraceae bacterium]